MATGKNTKGKTNNGGSQANVQHDGLMALESRVLFSAGPLLGECPGQASADDGAVVVEQSFADKFDPDPNDNNLGAAQSVDLVLRMNRLGGQEGVP